MTLDVHDLVTRVKAGDAAALTQLVHEYNPLVTSVVARVLGDIAEQSLRDVEQKVWTKAWLRIQTFRGVHSDDCRRLFGGWVSRIARNVAIDEMRHGRAAKRGTDTNIQVPLGDPPDAQRTPSSAAHARLVADRLREEIAKLSPQAAEIIRLRFHEALTVQQIGDAVGLTPAQVRYSLEQTTAELRKHLPD